MLHCRPDGVPERGGHLVVNLEPARQARDLIRGQRAIIDGEIAEVTEEALAAGRVGADGEHVLIACVRGSWKQAAVRTLELAVDVGGGAHAVEHDADHVRRERLRERARAVIALEPHVEFARGVEAETGVGDRAGPLQESRVHDACVLRRDDGEDAERRISERQRQRADLLERLRLLVEGDAGHPVQRRHPVEVDRRVRRVGGRERDVRDLVDPCVHGADARGLDSSARAQPQDATVDVRRVRRPRRDLREQPFPERHASLGIRAADGRDAWWL